MSFGFGFGAGRGARRSRGGDTSTPPLIVGAQYFDLFDDFETGGPAMTGRANWAGDLSQWTITSGAIHNGVQDGPNVQAFFGGARPTFDVTFGYGIGVEWYEYNQRFLVWRIDDDNQIHARFDTDNKRVQLITKVAGTETTHTHGDLHGTTPGGNHVHFLSSGEFRVQGDAHGHLRLWLDGQALKPPSGFYVDLPAYITDPDNRTGSIGVGQNGQTYKVLSKIGVRDATIVCTDIDRAVGQDAKSGPGALTGTPTITGEFSGSPVQWVYRAVNAADKTTVIAIAGANAEGWVRVTPVIDGSSYTMETPHPLGNHIIEHGFQTVAGGPVHSTFSPPTLAGIRIVSFGQSVSLLRGQESANFYAQSPNGAAPDSPYNLPDHDLPAGYMVSGLDPYRERSNSTAWGFINPAVLIADAPILFEAYGKPGAPIGALLPGGDPDGSDPLNRNEWEKFRDAVLTRKGIVAAAIIDHGQGDSDAEPLVFATLLYPNYAASQAALIAAIRDLADDAALPIFIAMMGRYGSDTPPASLTQAQVDSQRDLLLRLKYGTTVEGGGSDPDIHCASHQLGIVHNEPYHPTAAAGGIERVSERDAWSIFNLLRGAAHDGRGPIPISATRSSSVVRVQLDMNGAASLSDVTFDTNSAGTVYPTQPTNRFRGWDFCLASNFTSLLAVSSWTLGADYIDFTFASPPGAAVYLRNCFGAGFDDSRMVHGVYSGADHDRTIPVARILAGNGYLVSN